MIRPSTEVNHQRAARLMAIGLMFFATSASAQANETPRLDPSKFDIPDGGEIICRWAEKQATFVMKERQKNTPQTSISTRLGTLIETSKDYDEWRDLALVLTNNIIVETYGSTEKVSKNKISWASKDYGIWTYNQCLEGNVVGWKHGTVRINSAGEATPKKDPAQFDLPDDVIRLCEWLEKNSVTMMKHRQRGREKKVVVSSFKQKVKDTHGRSRALDITLSLIDLVADSAYASTVDPSYLQNAQAKGFGVAVFNRCIDGTVVEWAKGTGTTLNSGRY